MGNDKKSLIQYVHTDHFRWKCDWWKPKRVWCKWFNHIVEPRMYDRSYMVKINSQDWRKVKDKQQVDFCVRCKTVVHSKSTFDAKAMETKIAHMQVTEGNQ